MGIADCSDCKKSPHKSHNVCPQTWGLPIVATVRSLLTNLTMSALRNGSMQIRKLMTSAVCRSGGPEGPGSSFPFSITNRYKLTAYFVLFFGSGLSVPFLMVRHQLLKK